MKQGYKQFNNVLVDFGDEVVGSEQGGIRPAIILQNDQGNLHSPTTIVLPLTKQIKNLRQPTHTLIKKGEDKGLVVDSMVLGESVKQIDERRIIKYLGKITDVKEREEIRRVYYANLG